MAMVLCCTDLLRKTFKMLAADDILSLTLVSKAIYQAAYKILSSDWYRTKTAAEVTKLTPRVRGLSNSFHMACCRGQIELIRYWMHKYSFIDENGKLTNSTPSKEVNPEERSAYEIVVCGLYPAIAHKYWHLIDFLLPLLTDGKDKTTLNNDCDIQCLGTPAGVSGDQNIIELILNTVHALEPVIIGLVTVGNKKQISLLKHYIRYLSVDRIPSLVKYADRIPPLMVLLPYCLNQSDCMHRASKIIATGLLVTPYLLQEILDLYGTHLNLEMIMTGLLVNGILELVQLLHTRYNVIPKWHLIHVKATETLKQIPVKVIEYVLKYTNPKNIEGIEYLSRECQALVQSHS